ncbi:MAG: flagellar hook-length control protein FliK [Thermodesulfobacteriota bacterium]
MRRSVEGGDESVVCLDMEKGLSERWGLRGWDGDVRGMRGQAGLGNEHMGPISLPGQGGESQEAQYTPTFLGTVRDAGQLRHDEAIDIRSPPAPSLGRGAFGTSAGGSHGHLVNLIVDPPNLGPFRVKIQVRGGDLRALFLADGAVQKAALETGLWDLRQRLVHQGLSVQELAVQVGAHGGDGWQGYLSREGTWVSQDASSGVGPAPERQGPCTGAVTVNRAQDGGTLDLLI